MAVSRRIAQTFVKDPDEKLDYGFNWAGILPSGDTITASTWVLDMGITQSASPPPTFDDTTTTIWLEGGSDNEDYNVINRITTASVPPRVFEGIFKVLVRSSD